MFYSETILSRRGPLGKVWLAAHMERKLSKTQTLQTDIEQSVDAIMGQEIEVMALRLSGQLLLGVVRIYSRKAKYLLDDCNEALLKIKMAFRPGIVDMTEDQLAVNKNAITLQPGGLDLDLLLPDVNWEVDFEDRPIQPHGQHQADIHDITLRTVNDFQDFDLEDPFGIGPSDGIGSQDFDVDLGLDWDAAPEKDEKKADEMSIDGSVGVGRDAGSRRDSIHSYLLGRNGMDIDMDVMSNRSKSREHSEHPFDNDVNMDFPDLAGMDLGDFGIGFDDLPPAGENEKTPGQTRASSRASSPLSEPPATPPPDEQPAIEIPQEVAKLKRKLKEKKQIIDSITELTDGPGAKVGRGRNGLGAPVTKDVSDILTQQQFLPRSSVVMRLLTIRDDPLAHFLPTKVTPNGSFFCAAPPGLAPELAEMFMRPINGVTSKRRGASPDRSPKKRQRLDDEEVEQGRRAASLAPSHGLGSDIVGRESIGPDGIIDFPDHTVDDFQLDVPEFDVSMEGNIEMPRAKSAAPSELSRLSTPGPDGIPIEDGDETYADATCPIAMFDVRPSQTQTQATEGEVPSADHEGKGYSKNTIKAVSMIRKELQPIAGQESEDRSLSFSKLSEKVTASRRAAASFFFELLVLGTRDCLKLTQSGPFENIEIRAKDKLWEQQRHGSVAPSRFGSVALGAAMGL
ncbi:hypothetical protein C0993_004738 [Termitomyces sp. T159_Od127]|nr:hypothetical protein C0993_004738 [Termitomyces sp. T159_Od127]